MARDGTSGGRRKPGPRLVAGSPSDDGRFEHASVETGRPSAADTDCEGPVHGPEGRRELK